MDQLAEFYILTERFIKRNVDARKYGPLSDEAMERFIKKMVLMLTYETSPRKNYDLSRAEVEDIFLEVLTDLATPVVFDLRKHKAYSYVTQMGDTRLIFARTKRQAGEVLTALGFDSNAFIRRGSLQEISYIFQDHLITASGEKREFQSFFELAINQFGKGDPIDG